MGQTVGPPPPDARPLEAMEHRLRTKEGAEAYATRSQRVEPLFADIKETGPPDDQPSAALRAGPQQQAPTPRLTQRAASEMSGVL